MPSINTFKRKFTIFLNISKNIISEGKIEARSLSLFVNAVTLSMHLSSNIVDRDEESSHQCGVGNRYLMYSDSLISKKISFLVQIFQPGQADIGLDVSFSVAKSPFYAI